jgi:hypothetical protein
MRPSNLEERGGILLAWTTLLLFAPAALWLWTKCRPTGMRRGSATGAAASRRLEQMARRSPTVESPPSAPAPRNRPPGQAAGAPSRVQAGGSVGSDRR